MIENCDTFLIVGSSFPYAEWLPEEGQAQIDIDGRLLGMRYAPTEVNLVGDSKVTLQALIPLLDRKEDRSWQQQLEREVERWWRLMDERAHAQRRSATLATMWPAVPYALAAKFAYPERPCWCCITTTSTRSPGSSE